MKVSFAWLQKYVPVDIGLTKLMDALTMQGLEVESAVDRFDYLNNVFVGQIDELDILTRHENLSLCKVNCGEKSLNVVCGAKNVVVGMLVPVALPGTCMPNGTILSEKKIGGYLSSGMLCSKQDLAIGTNNEGVFPLNSTATPGQTLKSVLSLSDFVLEIDLTPNRSDCSNVVGIAREVAAIQNSKLSYPSTNSIKTFNEIESFLSIDVLSLKKCLRYTAAIFDQLKIGPSPFWLRDRLISVGLKPINNIVDITNFVMFEIGQPLHAFDFNLIADHSIIISASKGGEVFKTLDGEEYTLAENMLTISDTEKPIAIAGIIGGFNSRISEKTNKIILESAYFDPGSIRTTSKMLGITTESSYRFERGVDPNGALVALERAATLITELTGGRVIGSFIDKDYRLEDTKIKIDLNIDETNRVLGTALKSNQISSILSSVEFSIKSADGRKELEVEVPSFRGDITRPEDLMEEIARLYGYNNIPITFPNLSFREPCISKIQKQADTIRCVLNGLGFSEIINYSFTDKNSCDRLKLPNEDNRRHQVDIINPISSAQSVMRTSLIPPFLDTVQRNILQQIKNLMFFELGKVFISNGKNKLPDETEMLIALWTGTRVKSSWCNKEQYCDFYDIKGALEELLSFLNIENPKFTALPDHSCFYMRKGCTAQVIFSDKVLGLVGEIDTDVLESHSIKQKVFIFEINIEQLYKCAPKSKFLTPIPVFPAVLRDATVIVDERVESAHLLDKIKALDEILIEDIYLLNVFRNSNIQPGMKNITFRIIYRSHNATLDDKAINRLHELVITHLTSEFSASLPIS